MQNLELLYQIRAELLQKGFLRRPCIHVHAAHVISTDTSRKLSSLRCCCSAEPEAAVPDTRGALAEGLPASTHARSSHNQL